MPVIPVDPTADPPKLPVPKGTSGPTRYCGDWLQSYLKLSDQLESPELFHLFSGLFVISAALGRRCVLNKGAYNLYPNVFLVLVGGSAMVRKTTAIEFGVRVLKLALPELPVVAQKTSPEMLLSTLAKQFSELGRSEAVIVAEEMGVFLGSDIRNIPLVQLLTKLYNCSDVVDYATIGRGNEVCQNAYCVMLAGTTPEWLHSAFPRQSAEGGFTGRCLFIYSDKPRNRNAMPQVDQELMVKLAADLRIIGDLAGEFQFETGGLEWYKNWYEHDYQPPLDDASMDGYYGRKHDTVLKLAMLVSASKRNDLMITSIDLSQALEWLEALEDSMRAAMKAVHTTELGANLAHVLRIISSGGPMGVTHSQLLRSLSYKMAAGEVKEHCDTLRSCDKIEINIVESKSGGKSLQYVLKYPKSEEGTE